MRSICAAWFAPRTAVAFPSNALPSRKSTLPVGAGVVELVTMVAVSVIDWPTLLGFALLDSFTVVVAGVGLLLGLEVIVTGVSRREGGAGIGSAEAGVCTYIG